MTKNPIPLLFSFNGVVITLIQASIPLMAFFVYSVVSNINRSMEEAAQSLGASGIRTFFRITLPLSLPGLAGASLLTFAIASTVFIEPILIGGGRVITLSVLVYTRFIDILDWPLGSAIAFVLLAISLVIIFAYLRLLRYVGPSKGVRVMPRPSAGARAARTVVLAVYLSVLMLLILGPVVVTVAMSFTSKDYLSFPPSGFSLQWYDQVFSSGLFMGALSLSLTVAVITTLLVLAVSITRVIRPGQVQVSGAGRPREPLQLSAHTPAADRRDIPAAVPLVPEDRDRPWPPGTGARDSLVPFRGQVHHLGALRV